MSNFPAAFQVASLAAPGLPRTAVLLALVATAYGRLVAPRPDLTTPRSAPVDDGRTKPCDRQGGACWDSAAWDALSFRLTLLTCAFLASVVPRDGRVPVADTREPRTLEFVTALERASQLLVGASLQDSPADLAAAVTDAERRWRTIMAAGRPPTGPGP